MAERAKALFGEDGAGAAADWIESDPNANLQATLFPELNAPPKTRTRSRGRKSILDGDVELQTINATTLDRVHAAMLLQANGHANALRVTFKAVNGSSQKGTNRYKLFNDDRLRGVVLDRLSCQMVEGGLVPKRHKTKLALVCGNIASDQDRQALRQHFRTHGWLLWDDVWLRKKLTSISQSGYENSPVAVVSKLLLRG